VFNENENENQNENRAKPVNPVKPVNPLKPQSGQLNREGKRESRFGLLLRARFCRLGLKTGTENWNWN
jgi:hypothetical protein